MDDTVGAEVELPYLPPEPMEMIGTEEVVQSAKLEELVEGRPAVYMLLQIHSLESAC